MRFLLVVALLTGCANPPMPSTETANRQPPTANTGPRVIFPDGYAVRVEIAADPERRAEGLMFRDRLDEGTGMLFLFPEDNVYSFWMKNTRIPLDMIFIDANRRIVGISENVPPCKSDPCPSYGPNKISRYVLEVAGGVARQHNLKAGDVLTFERTEHITVR